MSEIKLVLTDIDGTVALPGDYEVSEQVRDTVIALENQGVVVAAVTGRPYEWAHNVLNVLGIDGPCVFDNGATVRNAKTGELLWSQWLSVKELHEIVKVLQPYYRTLDCSPEYNEHVPVEEELDLIDEPAPYVFVSVPEPSIEQIKKGLAAIPGIKWHYAPYISNGKREDLPRPTEPMLGLQITGELADKYHGVQALLQLVHAHPDETLAIGDGDNDLPLFRCAGLKIAMGNATEKLKAEADYIVGPVEEDGFADAMGRFVLASAKAK
ncbi:MAG TPA: HAD-IIB family hydrolase [Candidatus Saccharimonadales bacterium]|nr:HAD-IIB family hydrolase [Candidatus Saccharimonadales bacterium]